MKIFAINKRDGVIGAPRRFPPSIKANYLNYSLKRTSQDGAKGLDRVSRDRSNENVSRIDPE